MYPMMDWSEQKTRTRIGMRLNLDWTTTKKQPFKVERDSRMTRTVVRSPLKENSMLTEESVWPEAMMSRFMSPKTPMGHLNAMDEP